MPNVTGTGVATQLRPEAKETVGALLPVAPGAARLAARGAVAGGKYIAPQVGGLLDDYATKTGLQMYVYRPTSPSNPDPLVGTQFKREDLGGLVDKTITDLSNKQGAALTFMPWDNSSRNMKITQVSGVDIPPVITHGGQGYSRDLAHIKKGIGGASGEAIAKKIKTREEIARAENIAAGGTGEVIHTPITMAEFSENYSVQPTQVLLGLIDRTPDNKQAVAALNQSIRNMGIFKGVGDKRRQVFPFKDFAGVETEQGRLQLMDRTSQAGDLRKAFVSRAYLKSKRKEDFNFQREFGFNAEDIQNAILAPDLVGVGRGYGGNTLISSGKQGMILQPSKNPTYNTDMANMEYLGSLGYNVPVEVFMGNRFTDLSKEFAGKAGDLRSMTIGAIEKRNEGVSAMIDDAMLRRIEEYKKGLLD
jgi:hypothetical protein